MAAEFIPRERKSLGRSLHALKYGSTKTRAGKQVTRGLNGSLELNKTTERTKAFTQIAESWLALPQPVSLWLRSNNRAHICFQGNRDQR
jgi:hypothetical protein